MGWFGFDKEFHSKYMPTAKKQCGYCYNLDLYETKGVKSWCNEMRCYCNLYDTCGLWKDGGRSESQLREHCTWHISTMIGEILNKDLNEKPFLNIKKLREVLELYENKITMISLYDVYGPMIATNLYFDSNREQIAEAFMPVLNKVSDLVDINNYDEAFNVYYEMVVTLYKRYNHSLVNTSEFDYHNEQLNLFNEGKSKQLLIRK